MSLTCKMTLPYTKTMFTESLIIVLLFNFESCSLFVIPVVVTSEKSSKRDSYSDRMNAEWSNIAYQAAKDAKAAQYAQIPASSQAAYEVKEQLAEKAVEAARAAQAVFVTKTALVERLIKEKEAINTLLQEEESSKRQLEQAINGRMKALAGSKFLINILSSGLKLAGAMAQNADTVLKGIQTIQRQKDILLRQALHSVEIFTRQENISRADIERTEYAVRSAMKSAAEARYNAMKN